MVPSLLRTLLLGSIVSTTSARTTPAIECSALEPPSIAGAEITAFSALITSDFGLEVCNINLNLRHNGANDSVRIQTLLPINGYNGRFLGAGGGGLTAGWFDEMLAFHIGDGFAVAATDAGVDVPVLPSLPPEAIPQLVMNFAFLSVHEMTVASKWLVEQFYGEPVTHSYWSGCSMGGRQGLIEAQSYPGDYDGILVSSPVADWPRFTVASLWLYLVQVREDTYPEPCVWDGITRAAVEACDDLDGIRDSLISNPLACDFDAHDVVGKTVCEDTIVTETMAKLWNEVTAGPSKPDGSRAWYGFPPGTNLTVATTPVAFDHTNKWTAFMVERVGFAFDEHTIAADELHERIELSNQLYGKAFRTDEVSLAAFRDAGGKMVVWHGMADSIVQPQDILAYRQRVQDDLAGRTSGTDPLAWQGADPVQEALHNPHHEADDEKSDLHDFMRLFTAPGVEHCRGGQGAVPTDALGQLMRWVEEGVKPETLKAKGEVGQRELCLWPETLRYKGEGDVAEASSWTCV
ncbi:tannase and feruloyl esterase domain-containing protein [Sarocladium implicatum]|nr:tannase and feruloyl esterase domain-containing protein [Sarocladium implicatum]